MATEDPLRIVEQRIEQIEKLLAVSNSNDGVVDTLLSISNKLGSVLSRNEKVSSTLRRANEISKYASSVYSEPETIVPESVKLQLILSQENAIREQAEQLQKIQSLEKFVDSESILSCANLESQLAKLVENQARAEEKVEQACQESTNVLQLYNELVMNLSETLTDLEMSVRSLEEKRAERIE